MKQKCLLPFLFILGLPMLRAQPQVQIFQDCTVELQETDIQHLIVDPQNVNYNEYRQYYIPADNIQVVSSLMITILKELKSDQYNSEDEAIEQLEIKLGKTGMIYQTEEQIDLLNSSVDSEQIKQKFEANLLELESELKESFQEVKQELESTNYGKFKERINALENRVNNIVKSSLECFSEDYKIYQIQTYADQPKYGFSLDDIRNDPTYIQIDQFYEDIARIKRFNKFAFIDREGKVIIDYKYDIAFNIKEGLIAVQRGEYAYYIDKNEKEYLKHHKFKLTFPPANNIFLAARDKDPYGNYFNFVMFRTDSRYNSLDVVQYRDGYFKMTPFDVNGLTIAYHGKGNNPELLNYLGHNILKSGYPIIYLVKDPFVRHIYRCKCKTRVSKIEKGTTKYVNIETWGLVDNTGYLIEVCQFQEMSAFLNNVSIVKKDDKWGGITPNGQTIVPIVFDKVIRSSNGIFKGELEGTTFVINSNGDLLNEEPELRKKYRALLKQSFSRND